MHIAILTWWISSERSVALRSGDNMKDWIEKAGHTSEIFDFPSDIHRFLGRYQASVLAKHFPTKNLKKHIDTHQDFDLMIPVFHGIYGEDGQVTAFLKTLGCPYAYSDFQVHALCIDKHLTNLSVWEIGVNIPKSFFIKKGNGISKDALQIPFPLIVKPNRGGSSLSTSRVENDRDLILACQSITDDDILVQSCIPGREFTVWVYRDTTGTHVLPIIEIITIKQEFFDYEEKYESDGSNEVFSDIATDLQNKLEKISTKIYDCLGCRGVVRIDYRYNGMDLYFLEVNTIPGFTSGSLVPKMWKKAGKTEKEFIEMLLI